ncbi:src-like-adapter [Salmo salar]|uniref:Src-like-adapter n=1 Tax=Salmo salar TaxID=8030 RepID=A0ABM3D1T8_SALSA|nr:src-like-adapter [Salmo salar]|eukprot:XP_014057735.1 PREDICTED: src-like-adapter isoform X1 [Salmo salar]
MGNVRTSPVSMPENGDDTNTSSDPFLRNNDTLRVLSDYPSADVSETLVVLSDYPSADVSVPLFRIGERLRLLAEEGYWWRVCSVQTGYENYIPNNHVAKVYHGWLFEGVARPKAEELLRLPGNRAGSFMIRESQKGVYTLSVRHRVMVHYRIIRLPNNWYYISPGLTFQCLEDLVNHYSDCADGLCCILTTPCQTVTNGNLNLASQAPPVVMHNNFDWKDVNRSELTDQPHRYPGNRDSMISFGLRNTVSSYMSLGDTRKERKSSSWRRQKRRSSVCVPPSNGHGLSTTALEEEEEGEYAQAIHLNS